MDLLSTDYSQQLTLALQVLVASALGAAVGWEREAANRPAGFRTHALLAAAAALFIGLGEMFVDDLAGTAGSLRLDPLRVFEAIVTGVAFLGAGTIFRHPERDVIAGLTTAASLFLTAGIGVAVALHRILLAVLVTVLALVLLRLLRKISH